MIENFCFWVYTWIHVFFFYFILAVKIITIPHKISLLTFLVFPVYCLYKDYTFSELYKLLWNISLYSQLAKAFIMMGMEFYKMLILHLVKYSYFSFNLLLLIIFFVFWSLSQTWIPAVNLNWLYTFSFLLADLGFLILSLGFLYLCTERSWPVIFFPAVLFGLVSIF